jgi:hypothetical protein
MYLSGRHVIYIDVNSIYAGSPRYREIVVD